MNKLYVKALVTANMAKNELKKMHRSLRSCLAFTPNLIWISPTQHCA